MPAKKAAKKKPAKRVPTAKPPKQPRGRPTDYRDEFAVQAGKLCCLGATDKDIADFFGVDERTINRWKDQHADFCQSLKRGKMSADAEVADCLFRRATGYKQEAIKIMQHKGIPVIQAYQETYPPDVTACIFWLKNRRPDLWRDKVEVKNEHSGKIEGSGFTPEEDEAITDFVSNIRKGLKAPGT